MAVEEIKMQRVQKFVIKKLEFHKNCLEPTLCENKINSLKIEIHVDSLLKI